jgi:hypothetical protein
MTALSTMMVRRLVRALFFALAGQELWQLPD